jgi:hypothetical protein
MGFGPEWKEIDERQLLWCYQEQQSTIEQDYNQLLTPTIAQSSTEAEFTNMADAGKAALYLEWILEELGIIMDNKPKPILADNQGAVRLANAHQPTRRTRNVKMEHFIIYYNGQMIGP